MHTITLNWIIILVWIINLAISFFNARFVGLAWVEIKAFGNWWDRTALWSGAVMSALGFTWCYLLFFLIVGHYAEAYWWTSPEHEQLLTPDAVAFGISLGYVLIIPGVLASGFVIWLQSIKEALKRKSFGSALGAGWNTYAQIHNTYNAMRGFPEAVEKIFDFLTPEKGSKNNKAFLVLIIVVIALISGILTTWGLINKYAGRGRLQVN